MRWSLY